MGETKLRDGQLIAKARDEWFVSDEGDACLSAAATGQYLRNRLERAFLAGWEAARKQQEKTGD